ncbi:Het-C-domain-containing protein [Sparassis crispa]|uniref:Het-C-domain-containing protein n=1 Tax=Sparassis crispa TaxID=139825 RepID=A0A401H2W3_9APHY|nr:Het-C-domain-containing protein [Sparassis crispa]GBE88758.1 Het-C-domain-containing protein [Sparassis crispa]
MASSSHILLILLCILVFCLSENGVCAFGAGNIPGFAYMEGRAFRHGDIEDTLGELAKQAGGFALGALIGRGGSKFGDLDIKRVYFGNWLRDYSQAVDVSGLQKLQLQTIVNLCMVLGFMAHGYATDEFEVTPERLGVYLPIEHIDNPKGYPHNARQYHPQLRGPVDPRELDIDPRTGMKNYIANENGSWDTSKALVRRTLQHCIQFGRQYRSQGRTTDLYESYRLLGQALHTLEDFSAHSNFCELSLRALGHDNVFVHVGGQVRIQAPGGKWVAPLVTGTFGSSDFIHSLLGEATDHISEASVTDLNAELKKARAKSENNGGAVDNLRDLLFKLPGGSGSEMSREIEGVERIRAAPNHPGEKRPEEMSPQELHAVLWQVLTFRDSMMKKITIIIEKIPGLGSLLEKISDSVSVFVFTTLEPFIKPIMKQATSGLMAASGEVIDKHDQYEVFDDPRASDPTHSFLSKDHFNLILNEPAGHLAKIILTHTVNLVVKAWEDTSLNAHSIAEDVLQCLFHPDFHQRNSKIQRDMMEYMRNWVQGLGGRQREIVDRLSKDAVRNHRNVRGTGEGGSVTAQGTFAQNIGLQAQHDIIADVPGLAAAQSLFGKVGAVGSSASQLPGQAQAYLGSFGVGSSSGAVRVAPGGPPGTETFVDVREYTSTQAIPSEDLPYAVHHGHHPHERYEGQFASGQTASYYSESHAVSMPSEEYQASSYGTSGTQSLSRPYHREEIQSSFSSYAPPPGPPASFPSNEPAHSGYNPEYASGYNQSSFSSGGTGPSYQSYGRNERPGYGAYASPYGAPPPPRPGGPSFPGAYAPPPGPPPFPGQEQYPPPGPYGGPPHPERRYDGW